VADDPRWSRIVVRDRTADGHLWYSVMTTCVYCRPSRPSRLANPKNVQLRETLVAAKATGCRPASDIESDLLGKKKPQPLRASAVLSRINTSGRRVVSVRDRRQGCPNAL
jgi:methylphosphotriester-DNA--protein-cysteine methyltransferase